MSEGVEVQGATGPIRHAETAREAGMRGGNPGRLRPDGTSDGQAFNRYVNRFPSPFGSSFSLGGSSAMAPGRAAAPGANRGIEEPGESGTRKRTECRVRRSFTNESRTLQPAGPVGRGSPGSSSCGTAAHRPAPRRTGSRTGSGPVWRRPRPLPRGRANDPRGRRCLLLFLPAPAPLYPHRCIRAAVSAPPTDLAARFLCSARLRPVAGRRLCSGPAGSSPVRGAPPLLRWSWPSPRPPVSLARRPRLGRPTRAMPM